ncbi:MAG: DUF488 family protein [Nitrosopumilus sp.]|nr:DUF488 family protein [Nitrosopumilus sp.]
MPSRRAGTTSTIRTKSIHAPPADDDGLRVLVTRFHPRGVKRERYDVWCRDLAPSRELLKLHKEDRIRWDKFLRALYSEIRGNEAGWRMIMELNREARKRNVTLLCHERDGMPCHRHLVKMLVADPSAYQPSHMPENIDGKGTVPVQAP